ncbi:starch phosphorylase [Pontibacter ummariensis]|uniref:Starch phosphorylase n=1 Tax=Pontibacter ummariensis TaxID=1610492 RepID=A0A239JZL2_9BACT|nr:alpha-glucan family phosphorylase [Pontibacter ummariensis]PRY07267.1 starch phosphorylase [Pontibacter ummariensis]SNT10853.1 starch phosphorylase [Pontibacter ummariensis]
MEQSDKYLHPYTAAPSYQKCVAYFCMEYAIAQSLKLYAGGLGFLAGSHMRSAYILRQKVVGIGILWKYGYYDQVRQSDQTMGVLFQEKIYTFLEKTSIRFEITVNRAPVQVGVYYLPPLLFGTVPLFLLTTDLPENDYLAQTISHKLYDVDKNARIAASVLLGTGGFKLLELLNLAPDVYHLNEAHGLPLVFSLYAKHGSVEEVRKRVVFTTHTPEEAGNEKTDIHLLHDMSFFSPLSLDQARLITKTEGDTFNHSLAALRLAKISNAVSRMHREAVEKNWSACEGTSPIIHITNAQNYYYWADKPLYDYLYSEDDEMLVARKKELKRQLFEEVADQTGDMLHQDVFTIVWARRFAGYKRADLILEDLSRFLQLLHDTTQPVQIIWAGKPYPMDYGGISVFNKLAHLSTKHPNFSVLVGYELKLSKLLKQGADLWLNTPLVTHEASGTSGMSAAMNGAVLLSTADGWVPEFIQHGMNGFVVPPVAPTHPLHEQNMTDARNILHTLQHEILPMYYTQRDKWLSVVKNSMRDVLPYFDSNRLAHDYYEKMYNA